MSSGEGEIAGRSTSKFVFEKVPGRTSIKVLYIYKIVERPLAW